MRQGNTMPWRDYKSSSPVKKVQLSDDYKAVKRTRRKSGEFVLTLICDNIRASRRKGKARLIDVFPFMTGRTIRFERNKFVEIPIEVGLWLEENWANRPQGLRSGF